ncbi:hypothetical protein ACFLW4_05065 [Chloroflexota bacterium]
MVRKIYLDSLSSGMMARLDPAFRLSARRSQAELIGITHHGLGLLERHSPLSPVVRRKPLADLKLRFIDYRKSF